MITLTDMPKGFKNIPIKNKCKKTSSTSPQLLADFKKVEQFAVNNDILNLQERTETPLPPSNQT